MKRIRKVISLIICACMVICVTPRISASEQLKAGDTVYFGKYFNSYFLEDPFPNAEYVFVEVPDLRMNDNNKLEITKVDGQYYARRSKRSSITIYRSDPISWRVLDIQNN